MNEHIQRLLAVIDAYETGDPIKDTTLSFRVFGDSKTIGLLRGGADITTGRLQRAMEWLSDHWPENGAWPDDVHRPDAARSAA